MRDVLAYLKDNWTRPKAPEFVRNKFRKYINSIFVAGT
jgi:hypothetical protein